MIVICFTAALIYGTAATAAQVATGGNYTLDQAVIAAGGEQNSIGDDFTLIGDDFTLDGTIGQPAAGTRSTAAPFALAGGFWTANVLAPTAASVIVGGRVLTTSGGGLQNARVTLTGAGGNSLTVLSGKFGAFRFREVPAGETYIISVGSRRYIFAPQVVFVGEEMTDLNFTAVASPTKF